MRHKVYAVTDESRVIKPRPGAGIGPAAGAQVPERILGLLISVSFCARYRQMDERAPTARYKMLCAFIVRHKNKLRGDFH